MNEYRRALTPEEFKNQIVKMVGHDRLFSWANEKGIKRWVIETIEKGKIPTKHEHLVALANALNVSLDWLLTGEQFVNHPTAETMRWAEELLGEWKDKPVSKDVMDTVHTFFDILERGNPRKVAIITGKIFEEAERLEQNEKEKKKKEG